MKISLNTTYNYTPLSFQKNKYFLYADFDRTLSPLTTNDIYQADNPTLIDKAKKSFDDMKALLSKYKKKFALIITTGRALVEMKVMDELYKKQGIEIPEASSIIIKNGSEEIFIYDNDYAKYSSNLKRTKIISQKTHWDNKKINKIATDVAKIVHLKPVYTNTTLSAEKYSPYSIFSTPEKIKYNSIIFRNIGASKVFYAFNPYTKDETIKFFKEELNKRLNDAKIRYAVNENYCDKECGNLHTLTYSPVIDGYKLEKDYDVKIAIEKAKKNKDTVIVAGDSNNDFTMLNPLTYLNLPQHINKHNIQDAMKFIEHNEAFKKELKQLPLISIISVKKDCKEEKLEELNKYFGQNTEYKKVITTQEGNLPQTIDKLIK